MSIGILAGLLIVTGVVALALRPLFVARQGRQRLAQDEATQALENLLFEREATLLALRDLQFDREMGKLGDADFADLDARYRARAIQILRQLDALGVVSASEPASDSLDEWIERAVARIRRGESSAPPVRPLADEPVG